MGQLKMNQPLMWYEDLARGGSWSALWSGYTICGACSGIRLIYDACQTCGDPPDSRESVQVQLSDGREVTVPRAIYTGAEGRYEDYMYLQMMEREWKRPLNEAEEVSTLNTNEGPSPRAALVIAFWSYFETRIERLLREGLKAVPPRVLEDLLQRYSSIGARLDRLYRIAFDTTYFDDLTALGYTRIRECLTKVHRARNAFAHGNPRSIDDALVLNLVSLLKAEHESWIAIFNRRAAVPRSFSPSTGSGTPPAAA